MIGPQPAAFIRRRRRKTAPRFHAKDSHRHRQRALPASVGALGSAGLSERGQTTQVAYRVPMENPRCRQLASGDFPTITACARTSTGVCYVYRPAWQRRLPAGRREQQAPADTTRRVCFPASIDAAGRDKQGCFVLRPAWRRAPRSGAKQCRRPRRDCDLSTL